MTHIRALVAYEILDVFIADAEGGVLVETMCRFVFKLVLPSQYGPHLQNTTWNLRTPELETSGDQSKCIGYGLLG
jgi:hypothetical protein